MKEIRAGGDKGRAIHVQGVEASSQMCTPPEVIHRFSATLVTTPTAFITEIEKQS